jgi:hypothetical protein
VTEQGSIPRASTPRSARVTDGYDSDSDDDDVNEVPTSIYNGVWRPFMLCFGAIRRSIGEVAGILPSSRLMMCTVWTAADPTSI